jgi:hypothetical protein
MAGRSLREAGRWHGTPVTIDAAPRLGSEAPSCFKPMTGESWARANCRARAEEAVPYFVTTQPIIEISDSSELPVSQGCQYLDWVRDALDLARRRRCRLRTVKLPYLGRLTPPRSCHARYTSRWAPSSASFTSR